MMPVADFVLLFIYTCASLCLMLHCIGMRLGCDLDNWAMTLLLGLIFGVLLFAMYVALAIAAFTELILWSAR